MEIKDHEVSNQHEITILKELSDIKASLAVNTSETQNIKGTISEIKVDIRDIKTNAVTQDQFKTVVESHADHEKRIRVLEVNVTKILTWGTIGLALIGIIQFVLSKYF